MSHEAVNFQRKAWCKDIKYRVIEADIRNQLNGTFKRVKTLEQNLEEARKRSEKLKKLSPIYLHKPTKPKFKAEELLKEDPRVGKINDQALADDLGIGRSTVARYRLAHGIPHAPYPSQSKVPAETWACVDPLLGTMSDGKIARKFGLSNHQVFKRRRKLGIKAHIWSPIPSSFWEEVDPLLGTMPDTKLAKQVGIFKDTITKRRNKLGIMPFYAQEFARSLS